MRTNRFLTAFWALAKPYWVSEQRAKGVTLLVTVIGLSLGLVWINVQINLWNNEFFNAIQDKRLDDFYRLLGKFTLLADPKHVFGFQNVAPVVRGSVLTAEGPAFAETLNKVSSLLTLKREPICTFSPLTRV